MAKIDSLPSVSSFVDRFNLAPRKAWGQNFLFDLQLASRIALAGGSLEGQTVIEVGAGPGGLTRSILAANPERVIVIERDPRCLDILQEISSHYPGKLHIIVGDALKQDFSSLSDKSVRIIANLPYQIATHLLLTWLRTEPWPPWWHSAVLMFQKEVADRIVATVSDKAYGRLSVLAGWLTEAAVLFCVSPDVFVPAPKVSSAIVRLVPRPSPSPCEREVLENLTAAAFGQRRKMLRSSLKPLMKNLALEGSIEGLLHRVDLDGSLRAEKLDVAGFVRLANVLSEISGDRCGKVR